LNSGPTGSVIASPDAIDSRPRCRAERPACHTERGLQLVGVAAPQSARGFPGRASSVLPAGSRAAGRNPAQVDRACPNRRQLLRVAGTAVTSDRSPQSSPSKVVSSSQSGRSASRRHSAPYSVAMLFARHVREISPSIARSRGCRVGCSLHGAPLRSRSICSTEKLLTPMRESSPDLGVGASPRRFLDGPTSGSGQCTW